MVVESSGAWAPDASSVLHELSKAVALKGGEDVRVVHAALLQRLSILVRRARARAIMRRLFGRGERPPGADAAARLVSAPP